MHKIALSLYLKGSNFWEEQNDSISLCAKGIQISSHVSWAIFVEHLQHCHLGEAHGNVQKVEMGSRLWLPEESCVSCLSACRTSLFVAFSLCLSLSACVKCPWEMQSHLYTLNRRGECRVEFCCGLFIFCWPSFWGKSARRRGWERRFWRS